MASRQTTRKSDIPKLLLMFVGLLALAFAIYAPAIHAPFIWDDSTMVYDNQYVRASNGLISIWSGKDVDYFPMTSTLFWFEWRIFGDNPAGYRTVNILLHASSAFLVWRILKRLSVPCAGIAATVFCVHPVCVGTVAWVAELKNTLSVFLALLSALLFLRARPGGGKNQNWSIGFYALSVVAFALALLSKVSVVMLPFVFLAIVGWRNLTSVIRVAPYFLLSFGVGLVNIWFQNHRAMATIGAADISPLLSRVQGGGYALWFYLGKDLLPLNLMPIYPRWVIDSKSMLAWMPLLMWIVLLVVLWLLRRKPVVGIIPFFSIAAFTVLAIPVLGVVPISYLLQTQVADHLQYFPMIGVIALIGFVVHQAATRFGVSAKGQGDATFNARVAAVCIILALAVPSFARARLFANPEALWRDNVQKNPAAPMAWANLADAAVHQQQFDDAINDFRQSIRLDSDNINVREDFAQLLNALGRTDEAEAELRAVLARQPNSAHVHNNIGALLLAKGQVNDAAAEFAAAVKSAPGNVQAHINLANACTRLGRYDDAMNALEEAMRVDPKNLTVQANLERLKEMKSVKER